MEEEKITQTAIEEISADDFEEIQKSEEERLSEELEISERARAEAELRVSALEARVFCMEMGVSAQNAEDVIAIAERLGGDRRNDIAAVLEKYPFFRENARTEERQHPLTTGVHIARDAPAPYSGVEEAFRRANPNIKL